MSDALELTVEIKDFAKSRKQLSRLARRLPGAVSQAMSYEATVLAGDIRRGIRAGAPGGKRFAPLADSTKRRKKSSKPLINHGDLLRSIKSEQFEKGKFDSAYFVGVNKHVKARNGKEMWNIAEIHEFGAKAFKIKITEKMRAFWLAMSIEGSGKGKPLSDKEYIDHPGIKARPFLTPTFDLWKIGAQARIVARIKKRLGLKNDKG